MIIWISHEHKVNSETEYYINISLLYDKQLARTFTAKEKKKI